MGMEYTSQFGVFITDCGGALHEPNRSNRQFIAEKLCFIVAVEEAVSTVISVGLILAIEASGLVISYPTLPHFFVIHS
ncbi:uncharacterized protein H6S33_011802 [Morchella sextelata]|uniref:uncharacterized protein n=1 Tax=Morchella sextelata TaxID=1174677 RepID=UPI001D0361F2|nr:uncharacterized protein H6S33_011802 [Morchella sextelata]KAH0610275.1 hypothetical protein H6S33_011802 [Morchella sextelata]